MTEACVARFPYTMTKRTWTVPVDEKGCLTFPDELLEALGWNEGTVLSWDVQDDGVVVLGKSKDSSAE